MDGIIRFWDSGTGKEFTQHKGHEAGVASLAISADGKALVSGSADTTALIWAMPNSVLAKAPAVRLETVQLEALWNDLAGDAVKANRAIGTLRISPTQAVSFLKGRLRPDTVDLSRLPRLIADLDNKQFAVRQRAEQELANLGELAMAALQECLTGKPSLEVRQRVEQLLARVPGDPPPPDRLRALQGLEALERIGTPEARKAIEILAGGTAEAVLTRQSRASLNRLAR